MPIQEEILEILKQRLIPELAELKTAIVQIQADIRVINGRLDQIDKRLDLVDGRFEQVDKRFDQLDGRFEQIDKRFDQIDKRLDLVDGRFEQMERRLEEFRVEVREALSDMHAELRELRSFVFVSKMGEAKYQVREK